MKTMRLSGVKHTARRQQLEASLGSLFRPDKGTHKCAAEVGLGERLIPTVLGCNSAGIDRLWAHVARVLFHHIVLILYRVFFILDLVTFRVHIATERIGIAINGHLVDKFALLLGSLVPLALFELFQPVLEHHLVYGVELGLCMDM